MLINLLTKNETKLEKIVINPMNFILSNDRNFFQLFDLEKKLTVFNDDIRNLEVFSFFLFNLMISMKNSKYQLCIILLNITLKGFKFFS